MDVPAERSMRVPEGVVPAMVKFEIPVSPQA
jgi:hypothetical protein